MVVTVSIHDDGGCGSGGGGHGDGEEGIEQDSVARAGHHCNGDGDDGDGEPYVVFGYGSLIFRVTSFSFITRLRLSAGPQLTTTPTHVARMCMFLSMPAFFFVQPPPHVIKTSTCHFPFLCFLFFVLFLGGYLGSARASASAQCPVPSAYYSDGRV
jgi:hypothetical protein